MLKSSFLNELPVSDADLYFDQLFFRSDCFVLGCNSSKKFQMSPTSFSVLNLSISSIRSLYFKSLKGNSLRVKIL